MRARRDAAAVVVALGVGLLGTVPAQAAERFYGVTESDRLVTFHSDSPGAIRSSKRLTGLGRASLVAIDVRPRNGRLYGLGDNYRLYAISAAGGRVRPIGRPLPGRRSAAVGFDFNPTADKIRITNRAGLNARVDPDTGALVDGDADLPGLQPDARLRYDDDDRASPAPPRLGATAYNNRAGARRTTLYGIDQARNTLVRQAPPDEGVLKTVGRLRVVTKPPLRLDAKAPVGFDVARDGRAYATFRVGKLDSSALLRINLRTGRASPTAALPLVGTTRRGRVDPLRAFTAAGRVANDRARPRVTNRKLNDPSISQLLRGRALRLAVRCNEACTIVAALRLNRRVVGGAVGAVLGRRGRVALALKLTKGGKRLVRRLRPKVLKVDFVVLDAAGNVSKTVP